MNKDIVRAIFPDAVDRIERGRCPICAFKINKKDFRDELSRKEFEISGMCQKCQDGTFGKGGNL